MTNTQNKAKQKPRSNPGFYHLQHHEIVCRSFTTASMRHSIPEDATAYHSIPEDATDTDNDYGYDNGIDYESVLKVGVGGVGAPAPPKKTLCIPTKVCICTAEKTFIIQIKLQKVLQNKGQNRTIF